LSEKDTFQFCCSSVWGKSELSPEEKKNGMTPTLYKLIFQSDFLTTLVTKENKLCISHIFSHTLGSYLEKMVVLLGGIQDIHPTDTTTTFCVVNLIPV